MDARRFSLRNRNQNTQNSDLGNAKDFAAAWHIGGAGRVTACRTQSRARGGDESTDVNVSGGDNPRERSGDLLVSLKRHHAIESGLAGTSQLLGCYQALLSGRDIGLGRLGGGELRVAGLPGDGAGLGEDLVSFPGHGSQIAGGNQLLERRLGLTELAFGLG